MRPEREVATSNGQTYFVSFQAAKHTPLFRNDRWARLLVQVIEGYRTEYALHDFVIMHDHVHMLMTPMGALEKSVQLIKGGYSFRARREFLWKGPIWQDGFSDHRLRDAEDGEIHLRYIEKNVASLQGGTLFCGARAGLVLDDFPQWLKPLSMQGVDGGAEAPPLQSVKMSGGVEVAPLQSVKVSGGVEVAPLQSANEIIQDAKISQETR